MALPIRDGNQSLTTLSTILVSNSHIPAHTVVSLGTQAITDIATAVSGVELGPNTLNALENITVTLGQVTITGGLTDAQLRASAVTISGSVTVGSIVTHGVTIANSSVTIGGSVTATISGTPSVTFSQASVTFGVSTITGSVSVLNTPATQTVTFSQAPVTFGTAVVTGSTSILNFPATQPVSIASVTIGNSITIGASSVTFNSFVGQRGDGTWQALSLQTGSNYVNALVQNSVTIGSGTVTLGAGTAQIGSVTASGTVTANIGGIANSVTLPVRLNAEKYGEAPSGQDTLVVCNSDGMLLVDAYVSGTSVLGFDGTAFVKVKPAVGSSVTIGNTVTVSISGTPSVTFGTAVITGSTSIIGTPSVTFTQIATHGVTIGAGTAQIGSVTASISGTVPVSISSVTVGNSVTIGSLPAISGTVTANTFAVQGTAVTTSNFTSTTPSTVLANFNAGREVLTIFNEGAGNLHICAGATCTTIAYQVRLSAGDYYEVPNHQTTITHSAVFATAGTARVTEVS